MDVRSHGRSSRVFDPAACATDVLAQDVAGLLDHLGIPSASVIGFSMGGGIALELALGSPLRVRKLVIGGVGDAAINVLHDSAEVAAIAEAFSNPSAEPPVGTPAAVIRRNAEGAGNDLRALLPFLQNGGWPAGLRSVARLNMPSLVIVAEADEYMAKTDALLAALRPTQILRLRGKGHHQVMGDDDAKRAVVAFLRRVAP
jgi:pimeloyl-ACP methyl ester carboxylesterase